MKLSRFHKNWNYIHSCFFGNTLPTNTNLRHTDIPACLRSMVDILCDEEARNTTGETGVCMEYMFKHNILQHLCDVAGPDFPNGIYGQVVKFFTLLIDGLEDRFIVHLTVHRPLLHLIHEALVNKYAADNYDEELVELMFSICTKINGIDPSHDYVKFISDVLSI